MSPACARAEVNRSCPATQPCSDSRRKERRGRAVDRAMAAAGHLMQSAERQSGSRQMAVDRLETEGQHQSPAAGRALEAPDALAKLLDPGTDNGCAHVLGNRLGGSYVPYLFSLDEESQSESDGERGQEAGPGSFFPISPVNAALAATLVLLRTSKELSG
jgi:hypothetical protein